MIIVLGSDKTGKTVLSRVLSYEKGTPYTHFTYKQDYQDYIRPLVSLSFLDRVLDRFWICEPVYSKTLQRKLKFRLKEIHNLSLVTYAQNPIAILCSYKPIEKEYSDDYLPYPLWDTCQAEYKKFLEKEGIPYREFDYDRDDTFELVEWAIKKERENLEKIQWWVPLWKEGVGAGGQLQQPELLILAERLGPRNVSDIPFEAGPTGSLMSELLEFAEIPMGKVCITNLVKDKRGSTRGVNSRDLELFSLELEKTRPQKVVVMGKVAQKGIPIIEQHQIEYSVVDHLGFLNRKGGVGEKMRYFTHVRSLYHENKPREEEWVVKVF